MNTLYYRYVIMGKRTVDSIPASRRDVVKEMLIENGYTIKDDGSVFKTGLPDTENQCIIHFDVSQVQALAIVPYLFIQSIAQFYKKLRTLCR